MKNSPKRQRGLGLFGLVFVFGVIGFTALVVMRCWPIYLNQMKIAKAVRSVAADSDLAAAQDGSVLELKLARYWNIDNIDTLEPKKVKLVRTDRGRVITYKYEARTPLFYNISLVIDFEDTVPVKGSSN